MDRIYVTALGIETGDIVTTSYNTGPYRVLFIYGPRYVDDWGRVLVIRTWPVISLTMEHTDGRPFKPGTIIGRAAYINDVRHTEDGRWFTDSGDEIFIRKPKVREKLPMDMFRSYPPLPEPYEFDPDVDYTVERGVWKCKRGCGDFNAEPDSRWGPVLCPKCGYLAVQLILMEPRVIGQQQFNAHWHSVNRR